MIEYQSKIDIYDTYKKHKFVDLAKHDFQFKISETETIQPFQNAKIQGMGFKAQLRSIKKF